MSWLALHRTKRLPPCEAFLYEHPFVPTCPIQTCACRTGVAWCTEWTYLDWSTTTCVVTCIAAKQTAASLWSLSIWTSVRPYLSHPNMCLLYRSSLVHRMNISWLRVHLLLNCCFSCRLFAWKVCISAHPTHPSQTCASCTALLKMLPWNGSATFPIQCGLFWEHMPRRTWSVSRIANTAATRPQMGIVARQMWCKISLFGLMFGDLLQVCRAFTPVDGWNPAPVERYSLVELRLLLTRVYTSQEVQDSAINTVSWEIKRNTEAQYEVNVKRTNSQRKIKCCTNDFYFAAEMPKYLRKGSRNMLWIMHLQKSHNSGLEFAKSSHLEPKSHRSVVAHVTIAIVVLCFVRCAWRLCSPW